jgi:hypothetical protein
MDKIDSFRKSKVYKGKVDSPLGTPKVTDGSINGQKVNVKINYTMGPANFERHAKKLGGLGRVFKK